MPGSRILSVGHDQPERILTKDDLTEMVDTTSEWILSRVGIRERRIAAADEGVVEMAVPAARMAVEK